MSILGSMLARKFAHKMSDCQVFALPFALIMISMGTLFLYLNKFTIWVYLLNGIVQGWTGATLIHRVHTRTSAKEQTSVASVAKVVAQMIYVPIVWLIGVAADFEIRYACLATLIIFVPLGLIVIKSLKTDTNKKSP
jgi:sugar phosphate permease